MRIGELAKRTGIGRDAIRFYERNGLIRSFPSQDSRNDYRDYPEETIERLSMLREAQAAGFTLDDIRRFLVAIDPGSVDPDLDGFLDRKIAEMEEQIERNRRFLDLCRQIRVALSVID